MNKPTLEQLFNLIGKLTIAIKSQQFDLDNMLIIVKDLQTKQINLEKRLSERSLIGNFKPSEN